MVLHLFTAALARHHDPPVARALRIPSLYIPVPSPFPELERFITDSAQSYNLDLFRCLVPEHPTPSTPLPVESVTRPTTPSSLILQLQEGVELGAAHKTYAVGKAKGGEGMRRALETYKAQFPYIQAILVGTRRDDPHGGQ